MNEDFLPRYNRELTYIHQLVAEFSQNYPKVSARLRLSGESSTDPEVARLLECFAFLNARTRSKLDDSFPEISESLLGVVGPHYLAPLPAMAVVQFGADRGAGAPEGEYRIPRGTMIESELVDGVPCRFQTSFDTTLWPLEVVTARLSGPPFPTPSRAIGDAAESLLSLHVKCLSANGRIEELNIDRLRFYIHAPLEDAFELYERICNDTLAVTLSNNTETLEPVVLSRSSIQPVGFESNQRLFPLSNLSEANHELLTEFFAFPQKFLFFELTGLRRSMPAGLGGELQINFYFRRKTVPLKEPVSSETFRLGCVPIVNLYPARAEPISLSGANAEYRLVPDSGRPAAAEVYSIDRVTAVSPDGTKTPYAPFHSIRHSAHLRSRQAFWVSSRQQAWLDGDSAAGTDVYLSLVNSDFESATPPNGTLDVEIACTNRDLPRKLPFGNNRPKLQLAAGGALSRIICLTRPTATRRLLSSGRVSWRLVSQLQLNHLSITRGEAGAEALKSILELYAFPDLPEVGSLIESVVGVSSRQVVGPLQGDAAGTFGRGIEATVEFDEQRCAAGGVFLFASVLERFFAAYCTENSFVRFVAVTAQRKEIKRWPARVGERFPL
jgi:type VI secretion system protein ImpG